MTKKEIQMLADLIFDRIVEKQDQMDEDYNNQVLQTIMMILEGKEEYEKAAIILKKINNINKKLNDGSGKY